MLLGYLACLFVLQQLMILMIESSVNDGVLG
jgi:hypothetical protein